MSRPMCSDGETIDRIIEHVIVSAFGVGAASDGEVRVPYAHALHTTTGKLRRRIGFDPSDTGLT